MRAKALLKGKKVWLIWLLFSVAIALIGSGILWQGTDKTVFLPGLTSNGHYQIEIRCDECHTPFMGVKQDACMNCHKEELEIALNSHPRKKFTNPGNADLLEKLRADLCITCHQEHVPDQTHEMGVTLPMDYCFFCHETIGEERPTHEGLGFDTCLNCHNFHDNRSLYENFWVQHIDEPDLLPVTTVPPRRAPRTIYGNALSSRDQNGPDGPATDPHIVQDWAETTHAKVGVNCMDCHQSSDASTWTDHPKHEACAECHHDETKGFLAGRHGMRLSLGLSPMTPAMARLPMKHDVFHRELSCNSCHSGHRFDVQYAAVDACLTCHNDEHSLAYKETSHYRLWQEERTGTAPAGSGVSCATCHMPRIETGESKEPVIRVQHNQNDTLRPNTKMARPVCMKCHGLEFTHNALEDRSLIPTNYNSPPTVHLESMEWVKNRMKKKN